MEWLFPAVVASLSGTVVLAGTYLSIYLYDRKPFLLIWTVGWAVYALRFVLTLLTLVGLFGVSKSALSMANEIAALGSGIILLWGTCVFLGRPMPRIWLYLALLNVPWIILSNILELPFLLQTMTSYGFLGAVYVGTGVAVLRHAGFAGPGRNLTGWAFILWGMHKADYPFLRPVLWFAPWGYLLGATLEIVVAMGMLLIYFQTTRQEVEKSEERLRLILDSQDALVYVADMETYELLFMNKYGRDVWGECTGRKCWQVLQAGQTGPCAFCTNDRLLAADGAPAGVYAWEFQNTVNQHWYDCRDQAIPWRDGRLVRMEIATDITLRKQAEQEVRTAQEEWERTFASMVDIVTIQDANHRIVRANRQAGQVLGVPPEELVGRFCYEVFHDGTEPCDGCPALFPAGDVATHYGEIVHEKLGKTFSVSASPNYGPDGELVSSVYVSRDITELKALEGQLRQAQKMEAIGTLAGGIAHDFNNILTPVLGYAEILVESLPEGNPLAEPAREVLVAGKRARDLVRQILSFSRQTEQERYPIEIQLVVKEVLKLLRSSLPSTIEIRQNIDPQCGMVLADPTMIHQVMMNLCTNAYHAMRETGGVLGVTLTETQIGPEDYSTALHLKPGPYLRLEVSDTGGGMPRHILERIFEPYFTTKAKGEGTGLGLSVVHGIVTALGGHVTAYSEPGQGTTFHVYFPKYMEKKGAETAAGTAPPLPHGHERILVVDDETMIIELMQKTLEALGYTVTTCIDSRQALERFEAQPAGFDLVITDMTMPHLTGAELTQRLLAIRPSLPIILCTGFSEIINEEKAAALGIRRLLMKPVLRDELARALREELDKTE